MKKELVVILLFLLLTLFLSGCTEKTDAQQEYDKCTSVCASVVEDDFVTLEICREECKKQFLES